MVYFEEMPFSQTQSGLEGHVHEANRNLPDGLPNFSTHGKKAIDHFDAFFWQWR